MPVSCYFSFKLKKTKAKHSNFIHFVIFSFINESDSNHWLVWNTWIVLKKRYNFRPIQAKKHPQPPIVHWVIFKIISKNKFGIIKRSHLNFKRKNAEYFSAALVSFTFEKLLVTSMGRTNQKSRNTFQSVIFGIVFFVVRQIVVEFLAFVGHGCRSLIKHYLTKLWQERSIAESNGILKSKTYKIAFVAKMTEVKCHGNAKSC